MKRLLLIALVLVPVAILVVLQLRTVETPGEAAPSQAVPPPERAADPYIRAAHWFGEAWPVNFWNTELEAIAERDFQRLLDDGFNTVVFLVPWPGFAPDPRSGELDPERVARLRGLMQQADAMGLKTILRISYAWDWIDPGAAERLMQLWQDETHYRAWLDYIEALWQAVGDVPGLQFGFFSWEDLWTVTWFGQAPEAIRREAARTTGFEAWLLDRYDIDEAVERFGLTTDPSGRVLIPERRTPAYALFLEFMSEAWIERFFEPARARFPKLSMEIRIDSDPIYDGEEIIGWFDHRPVWSLPGADWVTLYWAPGMGGENRGELLSPELAADRLARKLDEVAEHAGPRQIFIGQFLFEDFTPGYESNGRIPHEDVSEFLNRAAEVLQGRTGGVGVWTWADYAHDAIANPEFFVGLAGWTTTGAVELNGADLHLGDGATLATDLRRFAYSIEGRPDIAELCVAATAVDGTARLDAFQGGGQDAFAALEFAGPRQRVCVEHELGARRLRLEADGAVTLHEVNSTGFVQRSGIRDRDFELKDTGRAYRALNAALEVQPRLLQPRFDDGWMGAMLIEEFTPRRPVDALRLDTFLPEDWPEAPMLTVTVDGRHLAEIPCGERGADPLQLPTTFAAGGTIRVRIESSAVHSPSGDARELGCLITDLSFGPAGDRPVEGQGSSG
ncbi:hypothetical protein HFP89_02970 [Wenzhouxiangella sp. XN79A]|uniref:hypothetical protein n=1 Tax=Wenzhouxiangella sp. XN79A TaxID=2724193 RepID=UPI00144AE29E|nr:hypothetical protein [Wenzhouxiangella sp. XN79A]NKI34127.1 hypothetical protein [Wenzhouxiangella sp. XN79A]